jgi:hypothetical protein
MVIIGIVNGEMVLVSPDIPMDDVNIAQQNFRSHEIIKEEKQALNSLRGFVFSFYV